MASKDINLLVACGEALYGSRWQTDLSEEIEVADRTMRRWLAEDTPIPAGVWIDIMRLMVERAHTLDELAERCKRAGAP